MAQAFTTSNFKELVLESDKVALVDFWAEWCGPCKVIGPVVEELASEYEGRAIVGKVNVDEEGDLASEYGIRNIPTILFFKNGEIVDRQVGVVPKNTLAAKLEELQ